jgi:hypothetical protein
MNPSQPKPGGKKPPPVLAHRYVEGQKVKLQFAADQQKISPEEFLHRVGQTALLNGATSQRFRAEFFDQVFIDVLSSYFQAWLTSSPEEVKKREYLYQSAMALGSVKETLLNMENLGRNIVPMQANQKPAQEDTGENGDDDAQT